MIESKERAIVVVVNALPYPEQIKNWDLSHDNVVRFTWRNARYRFDFRLMGVEEVRDGCLIGNDTAFVMRTLFKRVANSMQSAQS